jgi:hypothetical protein
MLSITQIRAQQDVGRDKKVVEDLFNLFFDSIKNKDTVSLKKIVHRSHGHFWHSRLVQPPNMTLGPTHSSSTKGFIQSVGNPNGFYGKCDYDFYDLDIEVYEGIAILSVANICFLDNEIEN